MEIRELNDDIDYNNKYQCQPLKWDVVWPVVGRRDLIVKYSEIAGIAKDSEIMEFMDYNMPMQVYRIEGYNHSISNNIDNLYICKRDVIPSKDTLSPFIDAWWNIWGIETKPKLYRVDDMIYSGVKIIITRNGKLFDTIGARELSYGLIEAQHMIHKLEEPTLPFQFFEIDYQKQIVGTKCLWKGKEAIITSYIEGQNCVMLDILNNDGETVKDHVLSESFDWYGLQKQ